MIGQRIGNYRVVRQIGEGGMGVVYEVVRDDIGGKAAIKVLRPEFAPNSETAGRFFNEARAANLIDHPSIVRIFDCGQLPSGAPYLAMELLSGESLHQRLLRERRISESATIRLGRQVAAALAAAHAKEVIHRDLKPENIFIVPDGEASGGERAKLLDFGIAKLARAHTGAVHTQTNMVMGTPIYMSPEQCKGSRHVGDRADVYALGGILFEMLAGRPPFIAEEPGEYIGMHLYKEPPSLSSLVPTATLALQRLVDAMLSKEPLQRPAMKTVTALLKSLSNLSSDVISVADLAGDDNQDGETQLDLRGSTEKATANLRSLARRSTDPAPPPAAAGEAPRSAMAPVRVHAETPLPADLKPLDPTTSRRVPAPHLPPAGQLPQSSSVPSVPRPAEGGWAALSGASTAPPTPKLPADSGAAALGGAAKTNLDESTAMMNADMVATLWPIQAASLPPDWQPVFLEPPAASAGNLDPDSALSDSPGKPRRSLGRRLRRLRFQLKRWVTIWLDTFVPNNRNTPTEVRRARLRAGIGLGILVLAIGAGLFVLRHRKPSQAENGKALPLPVAPPVAPPVPPIAVPPKESLGPPVPPELMRALDQAAALAESGKFIAAMKAARTAAKQYEHPVGWLTMGKYACRAGNLERANDALDHLPYDRPANRPERIELISACRALGVVAGSSGHLRKSR